jgi:hypothetical protein
MKSETKERKLSPYTILSHWFYDPNNTPIPEEVLKDKTINQHYLIYYFQQSPYGLIISKLFNNYGIYQLERKEVFEFMKQIIKATGYKPQFLKYEPAEKNKFEKVLRLKFPFMKKYEIPTIIEYIDSLPDKDAIYETYGFYNTSKKKKMTKAERLEFAETVKKNPPTLEVIEDKMALNDLLKNYE